MFIVRAAIRKDQDAIAQLHARNWQAIYHGQLTQAYLDNDVFDERLALWQQRFSQPTSNQHILVACDGKRIAGFICLYLDQHAQWGSIVDNLHISQHSKGQGLGIMLLTHAAMIVQQHAQSTGMYLEVLAANHKAQTFYQHMGGENIHAQQWIAPEGSLVDEYVYHWPTLTRLIANPPI